MHWWQTPFSSSSSSSSKHRSRDDSALQRIFSIRGRGLGSQQRWITRGRHLQRFGGSDEPPPVWRSPSSQDQSSARSSSVASQPLPLPELGVLLGRCSASSRKWNSSPANVPLPSPKEPSSRGGEERERADCLNRYVNGDHVTPSSESASTLASHDSRKNKEHAEIRQSGKTPQELKGVKGFHENYGINIPVSAIPSSFSSPALSPPRSTVDIFSSHNTSRQVFQVWSAPEMPPLDMNLGLGFSYQMYPEKIGFSVDSSPVRSPSISPRHRSSRSPSSPASPLHNKLSLDIPIAWRDSNAQANVHLLPRPPGATTPSLPNSVPQVIAKTDLMPRKAQWKKGKLIGRGTFGSVYVASNRETGALCAMKEVELFPDDAKSAECIKQLQQEIKVLSQLKHPNIVQYYGSEMIEDRFYIYLEYVHPGSINKYIHDHCGAITESVVRNFTRHILSGLAYLHSTKTIHRDIKGANLLVDAYGVVKLADFGMAKHLTGPAATLSLKGSPYWMAPELLQSVMQKDATSDLALAVDIWSLGCTIIEMLDGKPPWSDYEGAAAMFKVLRETPPIPEMLSSEGKDFLRCCFRRNPADRPSASMLLEHRFLKNSQQLDVPTCFQEHNGMKLNDKAQPWREHPISKHDQLLLGSLDAKTSRGKPANTEVGRCSYRDTCELTVVPRHSPRSTLEALPSLSPPHSDQSTHHPSPCANMTSSIKEGAKKNQYSQ